MTALASNTTDTTAPVEVRLRMLLAAGTLAQVYPQVRGMLGSLDDAGLRRAGAVLARLDVEEVLARHPTTPVVTIAVTGSGTVEPILPPLVAQLARHGFLLHARVGAFGHYAVELTDPHSELYQCSPDITLCLLDAYAVFDQLATPWTVADVVAVLDRTLALVTRIAQARHRCGTLVFNTVPLLTHWAAQLVDYRSRTALGAAWRRFNADLLELGERPGVVVLDLEPLICDTPPAYDARIASYAKVAFSDPLFDRLAREVGHLARSLHGRTRKCLVLDLDGTLWGGVLADDGADGLEVCDGYRGAAFHAFQRVIKQLGSQGPLLAVCTKNDDATVRQALRTLPGLALAEDDFVAIVANWEPKPGNIQRLAETLGIGVDSLVYIDDSPAECGMVRRALPDVAVIDIEATEPALHAERLLLDGWFVTQEVTEEDRVRAARYRAEDRRQRCRAAAGTVQEYLAELHTTVELFRPGPADVARLAQLTQRTNRFNLTNQRLDGAAVRRMLADPAMLVLAVRCADRFGDHGTVGAVFGRWQGNVLDIDNFLLSCRVLARGVESACLHAVLTGARRGGAVAVRGHCRPTAKNQKARGLYRQHGFADCGVDASGTESFEHDLSGLPAPITHISLTTNWPEDRTHCPGGRP